MTIGKNGIPAVGGEILKKKGGGEGELEPLSFCLGRPRDGPVCAGAWADKLGAQVFGFYGGCPDFTGRRSENQIKPAIGSLFGFHLFFWISVIVIPGLTRNPEKRELFFNFLFKVSIWVYLLFVLMLSLENEYQNVSESYTVFETGTPAVGGKKLSPCHSGPVIRRGKLQPESRRRPRESEDLYLDSVSSTE